MTIFASSRGASAGALAVLLFSSAAFGGQIKVAYHFEAPRIEIARSGFVQAIFDNTVQAGKPGEPSYPMRGCQILLPPGESVVRVAVERKGWKLVSGDHRLYPAQEAVPSDPALAGPAPRFLYKAAAYQVDAWVSPPEPRFTTHYLRGHAIATGCVSPLAFRPASGEVGYWSECDVTIETASSREASEALQLLRADAETNARLARLVDNAAEIASLYGTFEPLRDVNRDFEYLIITRQSLAPSFLPLKEFYDRRGMRAEILTVEEIESGYTGRDTAEKIRTAIKDKYATSHITHVLLGGDADGPSYDPKVVPARGLFCEVHSSELYTDDDIPADIYYANLDGTWNADGDAHWGEPGEEDAYAEVAVGRACVDDAAEVATFIAKTEMYQDHPVAAQTRSVVMLGEKLYDDPLTYGEDELEQLIGTCAAHGFTTTGFPASDAFLKKYDRTAVWTSSDAIGAINAGAGWVVHSGHSNWIYVMRIGIAYVTDSYFTNDGVTAGFPIVESNGCYPGSFDNRTATTGIYYTGDCIAEQLLGISHGAVAYIGNSRYGWFTEGTTNGPSHHLERELFDAIFAEGYHTLGTAVARSKDQTAPFLDLPDEYEPGAHRWCFYTMNLLGDPALDAWTDTPESLEVMHPDEMSRSDTALSIEAAPGAVACLWHGGLVYGRAAADPSGHIDLVKYRAIADSVGSLELTVRAHDHYIHRVMLPVVAGSAAEPPAATAALEQNVPNPFNPVTTIRYSLARDASVDVRVYDAAGREVARLASGRQTKGAHEISWRPTGLASGIYFYRLRADGVLLTRKAVLLR